MTTRGYSTSALVQTHMQRTLSADQLADADRKIEAVEQFLDAWSGQVYTATGPVVDEMLVPTIAYPWREPVTTVQMNPFEARVDQPLGQVQLKGVPVGSIIAVRSKPGGVSPDDDVAYVINESRTTGAYSGLSLLTINPEGGLLDIPGYSAYPYVFVTYTSLQGVPAIFREITTQIVAYQMPFGATATPSYAGPLSSYSLGGDLSMSFAGRSGGSYGAILAGIPDTVWPLLMSIKRWSIG